MSKVLLLRNDVVIIDKTSPVAPQHTNPFGYVQIMRASFTDEGIAFPATDIFISLKPAEAQELSAFFSDLSRRLSKAQS